MAHSEITTARFRFDRYGNGVSVVLTQLCSGLAAALQGDDAERFEEERDLIESVHPDWDDDAVFAWLWDQCDYGSAAQ